MRALSGGRHEPEEDEKLLLEEDGGLLFVLLTVAKLTCPYTEQVGAS